MLYETFLDQQREFPVRVESSLVQSFCPHSRGSLDGGFCDERQGLYSSLCISYIYSLYVLEIADAPVGSTATYHIHLS